MGQLFLRPGKEKILRIFILCMCLPIPSFGVAKITMFISLATILLSSSHSQHSHQPSSCPWPPLHHHQLHHFCHLTSLTLCHLTASVWPRYHPYNKATRSPPLHPHCQLHHFNPSPSHHLLHHWPAHLHPPLSTTLNPIPSPLLSTTTDHHPASTSTLCYIQLHYNHYGDSFPHHQPKRVDKSSGGMEWRVGQRKLEHIPRGPYFRYER